MVYALSPHETKTHFLGTPFFKGLGEICVRQTCLDEGNLPLTAKSLSAGLVYHTFAFRSSDQ